MALNTAQDVKMLIAARMRVAKTDDDAMEAAMGECFYCFQASAWQRAVEKAIDIVASVEARGVRDGGIDQEMHASGLHNIASALHQLGHHESAKALYEEAATELEAAPSHPLVCCLGDLRPAQLMFIQARAAMLVEGKTPDGRLHLDGLGREARWTDEEVAFAKQKVKEMEARDKPALSLTLDTTKHLDTATAYPVGSTPRGQLW